MLGQVLQKASGSRNLNMDLLGGRDHLLIFVFFLHIVLVIVMLLVLLLLAEGLIFGKGLIFFVLLLLLLFLPLVSSLPKASSVPKVSPWPMVSSLSKVSSLVFFFGPTLGVILPQLLPASVGAPQMGNVSGTPTPTTCLKSMAVHLQFVRQYAPHLYRRTFLELSFEERETLQYASHLYGSTPPICTAVRPPFVRQYFWKNTGGWGHRNISDQSMAADLM